MNVVGTRVARQVRCPRCDARCDWDGNPHRPFCSLACRLIDLGGWLDERYRIPGSAVPDHHESEDREPPSG